MEITLFSCSLRVYILCRKNELEKIEIKKNKKSSYFIVFWWLKALKTS
jgi:hypothetical protein